MKDIIQLSIITVFLLAVMYVGWLNSPMYQEIYRQQRMEALDYLKNTRYFYPEIDGVDRNDIIKKYDIQVWELERP